MDSEYKKLLAGDLWAQDGDRVDMDDPSVQPIINRDEGYTIDFSTDTAPSRARINQLLRELAGAAKEVRMGVSEYDAEVAYPVGAMCQVSGNIYYAVQAHNPATPVNPITQNNSTWVIVAGRVAEERTVPDVVPNGNIFIDGERADRFAVWWFVQDTGGHPITEVELQYSKSSTFASGVTTVNPYTPGTYRTISTNDSDLFYVRIRLRNSAGWSQPSAGKKVRTNPLAPGDVINLTASAGADDGDVDLKWTRPETNGLTVNQYRILWKSGTQDYSTASGVRNETITNNGTTITHELTGLPASQQTTILVQALSNRNTYSAGGNEATVTASGSADAPSKPALMTETPTPTTVRAYLSNILNTNKADIDFYEFSHKINNAATWTVNTSPSSSRVFTRGRGDTIQIRLRAHNASGYSEYSDTATLAAYVPAVPDAPTISVESSLDVVPGSLKGIVSFSMGEISSSEVVKDRIVQTAIRWRQNETDNWSTETDSEYPDADDNDFAIPQIFPTVGNLPTNTDIFVQARWRNSNTTWGDWSDTFTLTASSAPSGNLIFSSDNIVMREGQTAMLSVKLSRLPIEDVTIAITSDNTDLTLSSSSLTFTIANWDTDQTITLTAIEDADLSTDLANLSFAVSGGLDISTDTVAVRITERARLLTNFNNSEGEIRIPENYKATRLYCALTAQPDSNVSVSFSDIPTNTNNVRLSGSSLTFTPSNWYRAQYVNILTDRDSDSNESAEIPLTITATGGVITTINKKIVVTEYGTNPRRAISLTSNSMNLGVGLSLTNQIYLSGVPEASFVCDVVPLDPSVTVSPSTLTIFRTSWEFDDRQTITVSASSASEIGGQTAISLEPRNVNDVQPNVIPVMINHPIRITPDIFRVAEGNYIDAAVRPESAISSGLTITPSSNNSELSFNPTNVKFTTTNWTSAQNIRISSALDTDVTEENDPVVFTPSGAFTTPVRTISTTVPVKTNEISSVYHYDFVNNNWDSNTRNPGFVVSVPSSRTVRFGFTVLNNLLEQTVFQLYFENADGSVMTASSGSIWYGPENNRVFGPNGIWRLTLLAGQIESLNANSFTTSLRGFFSSSESAGTKKLVIRAEPNSRESIPIFTQTFTLT